MTPDINNIPHASLRTLFVALTVTIAEIDDYAPGELSTQKFLGRWGEYLDKPEQNLPQLLIEEEQALRTALETLRAWVNRSRQLLDS